LSSQSQGAALHARTTIEELVELVSLVILCFSPLPRVDKNR
jgi:hypothetical protein